MKNKKKALILVNHDVVIYNFRKELAERLLNNGYEVCIASPYGKRIDFLIEMGCQCYEMAVNRRGTNPIKDLKLLFSYLSLIKKIKPDLVLTYTIKPNIYGGMACELLKIPYIATITGLGTAIENKGLMQKLTVCLYRMAFQKIHCLFFQNTKNQAFFKEKNIAVKKQQVIPGSGVNLDQFSVLDYPKAENTAFVFIGRIMKDKGVDEYLEAATFIKNKYPKTEFHLCGFCEDAYEERLKTLEEKKVIHYHGMIEDSREILKRTHATILPSYHEGMANVLLESAACARPVLSSRVPGCQETFDDGISGFGFEAKNSTALCDAIEKFIAISYERKKAMGLAGRKKMEKTFDRQIVVEAYLKEIKKVEG